MVSRWEERRETLDAGNLFSFFFFNDLIIQVIEAAVVEIGGDN